MQSCLGRRINTESMIVKWGESMLIGKRCATRTVDRISTAEYYHLAGFNKDSDVESLPTMPC